MADREPVVLNGRYELHARIARGGMAEVFLARDQVLDRSVAVKVLFPEFATDPAFVERFRREAQSAANLTHPAIVGVYDWGSYRGTYFIVMEYVRGRSLAEILRAEGTLHPDRAADIATDIAGALYFAHRNGVVHRDIKPGNVLITPQGHVKVTDFGIARAVGGNTDNLTQAGSVMGTATYFSPEQAQGLAVDPRSDLYSLGVVLYEMVCGHPPFAGDSPVAIAYQHVQGTPTPPRQVDPAIPQALEAITLKLLAKNPANRYASAEELRADLRRYREGQPVLAEGVLAGPAVVGAAAVAAHGAGGPPAELTNVLPPTVAGPATGGPPGTDPTALGPSYTGAPNYEPPRRNGVFIAVLVVLLALLGVLLFFFARTVLGDEGGTTGQVTVPNVVGKQREEAEAQLQDEGLEASPQFQASATVEPNRVISQQPAANTTVDEDSTVVIVVSQPVATVRRAERGRPDGGTGPPDARAGRLHEHQPDDPGRAGHHQEGARDQPEPGAGHEGAQGPGHRAGRRDGARPGDVARRGRHALRPGRQRAGGVGDQLGQHPARRPGLPAAGGGQRDRHAAVRHGGDEPEAPGAGVERPAHRRRSRRS